MAVLRSNFSLKTLFLLMTSMAVLVAAAAHAHRQPVILESSSASSPAGGTSPVHLYAALTVGCLFVGAIAGTCWGLRFHRRIQGALIGFFSAVLTAGLAAALVTGQPSLPVALGGCCALVVVSLVLRAA